MNLKTLTGMSCAAFFVFLLIKDPASVSQLVINIGNFLGSCAAGLSNFVSSI